MLTALHELLALDRLPHVVDIGANPIDGDPPYKELLASGLCRLTGFEPQADALAALNRAKSARETYLPYAVGDGTAKTLYVCRYPGFTSTLKPDALTLDVFQAFKANAAIVREEPVSTRRLDDIAEVDAVDFLKIDIQGGELDVFRHGRGKLGSAVMIQTEVSFVTLYENQPALGDVDLELRRQGFIPHCIPAYKKAVIAPFMVNNDPHLPLNQALEADMVYVRDFRRGDLTDRQLKALCLLAHSCYRSYDLATRCVLMLETRGALPAQSRSRYLAIVRDTMARDRPARSGA